MSCFTFHLWIVHFIVVDLLFSQISLSSRGWSVWWDGTFKFFRVDQVQTSPIHQTNSQSQLPSIVQISRSVAGGKGGRPTAASLPSRDRHSVFTQRKQNMPLLWLRIPLHDIGGARMWMSCLPRCSLKCQASWGERGLRAGSAYLPSSPLHLIVAAKNAWQRLERGEEYRQLVESGCFGKISTFRMCGVKRGGGWARGNNWEEYFSAWPT